MRKSPVINPRAPVKKSKRKWHIYAVECDNGSVYIGMASDLEARWEQHRQGRGAQWTRRYKPVRFLKLETVGTIKEAMQRERAWKRSGRRKVKVLFEDPADVQDV